MSVDTKDVDGKKTMSNFTYAIDIIKLSIKHAKNDKLYYKY